MTLRSPTGPSSRLLQPCCLNPGKQHALISISLACGSPLASPLVSPKRHFWGSVSSAGAAGPNAHVRRAPSDWEQGDQMAYNVTRTACEGLCIAADNAKPLLRKW